MNTHLKVLTTIIAIIFLVFFVSCAKKNAKEKNGDTSKSNSEIHNGNTTAAQKTYGINGNVKILFDNTKAETAGNADWVVDEDLNNLRWTKTGPKLSGNEGNAQRIPTPAQSGITASTPETYWKGALSSWAVDCAKKGYSIESLPYDGKITYGDATNSQDLSNYKIYVIDEPNYLFTSTEKTSIIKFVYNGGSLFIISDHNKSDRNGDGYDSPAIWNDLMTNNSVKTNPFGITFDLANFSGAFSNIANLPSNPIIHGSFGEVTEIQYSNGTSMTLNTTSNNSVKGIVFKTTSTSGSKGVLVAYSAYGAGKIVAIGDSSLPDDGTGDNDDKLYNGYTGDASGNHRILLMNAIVWLAN